MGVVTIVGCGGGGGASAPVPVTISLSINDNPKNQTAAVGGSVTFSVAATAGGTGTLSYQWRKDGAAIPNANAATYTIASVTAASAGSYDCVVTSTSNGSVATSTSGQAVLSIAVPPTIRTQPASLSRGQGASATFTVAATSGGTLSYQWFKGTAALADGPAITGSATASLTLAGVTPADEAADYHCEVTSTLNGVVTQTTSKNAVLVVAGTPVISAQPASQGLANAPALVSFSVKADGNGVLSYRWFKGAAALADGGNISGSATAILTLTSPTSADSGVYTCLVTNTKDTASAAPLSSAPASLTVGQAPAISSQPSPVDKAQGANAAFAVTASGPGTLSYQWFKGAAALVDGPAVNGSGTANLLLLGVTPADEAGYACVVTSTLNGVPTQTTSNSAILRVAGLPAITSQPANQNLAQGATATFSVAATGNTGGTLTYQWYKNGVVLSDGASLSGSQTATLRLTSIAAADAGSFTCVVTNTKGAATASQTTNPAALTMSVGTPTITASPASLTQVAGTPATFSVTATGNGVLSYQWRKNSGSGPVAIPGAIQASYTLPSVVAGDAASYDCVVTNTFGTLNASATSGAATLAVNTAPTIKFQPQGGTFLLGQAFTSTVNAPSHNAVPSLSYQWLKNGVAIPGATASSLNLASVAAADAADYTCTVTDTVGSSTTTVTSAKATLAINLPPTISTPPAAKGTTAGSSANYSVTAASTNGGTLRYQWQSSTDNGTTWATATGTSTNSGYSSGTTTTAMDGTLYRCIVFNDLGGTTSQAVTAGVVMNVTAPIGATTAVAAPAGPFKGDNSEAGTTLTGTVTTVGNIATAIGAGDSVAYQWQLSRDGGSTYANILGATGPLVSGQSTYTYAIPHNMSSADAGIYKFVATTSKGIAVATSTGGTVTVGVLSTPALSTDLSTPYYWPNAATQNLTIAVSSSTNFGTQTYAWQSSTDGTTWGPAAGGPNAATYAAPASATPTAYRCQVFNTVSGINSPTVTSSTSWVTRQDAVPAITMQSSPDNVTYTAIAAPVNVVGGAGTLYLKANLASAVTYGTLSFRWFKNSINSTTGGVAVPGGTNQILTLPAPGAGEAGYYYCVVTCTQTAGSQAHPASSNSAVAQVGINVPPVITTQPTAAPIVAQGGSVTLSVAATGAQSTILAYQWKKGATSIPGANSNTLTLSNLGASDAAVYTCAVTSTLTGTTAQTVTSGAANLSVNLKPTVSAATVAAGSATLGSSITLSVTASDNNGTGALSYQWYRNGVAIGGAGLATYTIPSLTANEAGSYACAVSCVLNGNKAAAAVSSTTSAAYVMTLGSGGVTTPTVSLNGNYSASAPNPIVLTTPNQGTGVSYEWSVLVNGAPLSLTPAMGQGTPSLAIPGTNLTIPAGSATGTLTVSVVASNATTGAVSTTYTATLWPLPTAPQILAPSVVHPGDAWMKASLDAQASSTYGWSLLAGANGGTGAISSPTNLQAIAFNASSSNVDDSTFTLNASVQNMAGDTSTLGAFTVSVARGAWVAKDGSLTAVVGQYPAAVTLANGRVLVCGGTMNFTPVANAAIFDPATGLWISIPPMNTARYKHTATLLPDGKVLVVGGYPVSGGDGLNTVEYYDPATNAWVMPSGTLGVYGGRYGHTATFVGGTTINNFTVAVVGGQNGAGYSSNISTIRTNSDKNSWTFSNSAGALTYARGGHTATRLGDGRLLLVGGTNALSGVTLPMSQAEVFDPLGVQGPANTTYLVGSLTRQNRLDHTATLLNDGTVFIAGGSPTGAPTTAEIFDPATDAFTAVTASGGDSATLLGGFRGTDAGGRSKHTATLLTTGPNAGKVLLAGGTNATTNPTLGIGQSVELYTPASLGAGHSGFASLLQAGAMTNARFAHAAATATLPDGTTRVLVLGGSSTGVYPAQTNSAELFDPATSTWSSLGIQGGRQSHTATRLPDGTILVVGGKGTAQGTVGGVDSSYLTSCQIYNPATGVWTATGSLSVGRYQHTATVVPYGGGTACKVIVTGGQVTGTNTGKSVEVWDSATGTWTNLGFTLKEARYNHSAVALPNGNVLLVGGQSTTAVWSSTSELLDANGAALGYTTGTGSSANMSEPKGSLTPALVNFGTPASPDWKVVVPGGSLSAFAFSQAIEVFDVATQAWSQPLANLSKPHGYHTATLLQDGRTLAILGGRIGQYTWAGWGGSVSTQPGTTPDPTSPMAEILTLGLDGSGAVTASTRLSSALSKTEGRLGHGAALLPSGKVLIFGGNGHLNSSSATAEVYDPVSDTFTAAPSLAVPRGAGLPPSGGPPYLPFPTVTLPNGDVVVIGGGGGDSQTEIYRE